MERERPKGIAKEVSDGVALSKFTHKTILQVIIVYFFVLVSYSGSAEICNIIYSGKSGISSHFLYSNIKGKLKQWQLERHGFSLISLLKTWFFKRMGVRRRLLFEQGIYPSKL